MVRNVQGVGELFFVVAAKLKPLAKLVKNTIEERLNQRFLEIEVGLALSHHCTDLLVWYLWQCIFHSFFKLGVGYQLFKYGGKFFRTVRTNIVKYGGIYHGH